MWTPNKAYSIKYGLDREREDTFSFFSTEKTWGIQIETGPFAGLQVVYKNVRVERTKENRDLLMWDQDILANPLKADTTLENIELRSLLGNILGGVATAMLETEAGKLNG